jgi:hypothetical protein
VQRGVLTNQIISENMNIDPTKYTDNGLRHAMRAYYRTQINNLTDEAGMITMDEEKELKKKGRKAPESTRARVKHRAIGPLDPKGKFFRSEMDTEGNYLDMCML